MKAKKLLSVIFTCYMLLCAVFAPSVNQLNPIVVKAAYENTWKNTGNQCEDIIGVAESQVGYIEGSNNYTKYNLLIGKINGNYNYPWCQAFVSWCAAQANISTSIIPRVAGTGSAQDKFNEWGRLKDARSYTPKRGDLLYTKNYTHVALVLKVEGNNIYTVEGNYEDRVCYNVRHLSDSNISCYGVPNYNENNSIAPAQPNDDECGIPFTRPSGYPIIQIGSKGSSVGWVQTALNKTIKANLDVDCDFGNATEVAVKSFQSRYNLEVDGQVGEQTIAKLVDLIVTKSDSQKGYYKVINELGAYIRREANSNSAIVSAAPIGTVFEVTDISGEFAFTNSINSFVGDNLSPHSGWVMLNRCEYIGTSSSIANTTTTTTTTKTTTTTAKPTTTTTTAKPTTTTTTTTAKPTTTTTAKPTTTTTTVTTTKATTTSTTTTTVTTTEATTEAKVPVIIPSELTLQTGETSELIVLNCGNTDILWKSNNSKVAEVENGVVTALSEGKATIYAIVNNVFCEVSVTVEKAEEIIPGDANCDGKVNMSDAALIMQYLANPSKYGVNGFDPTHITEQGVKNADITGNNDGVTNLDALYIQSIILGLVS